MLSRTHRFHGYNAMNHVYKQARPVRVGELQLRVVRNTKRTDYRVAVVVSKKVSKSAVVRNRIRRRLFEALRRQLSDCQEPLDILVSVFDAKVANIPAPELETMVLKLLQRSAVVL